MKKYWNKLAFAAIAFFAAGAVACSDDESELPGYYTENFAYLELYPDTNTATALSATHDARGVFVSGSFVDFQVKLRWPVGTDTKLVLGGDPDLAASDYDPIPENAVTFAAVDPQTGEAVEGDIVIPAGESVVNVRATLLDTSFAVENKAASKYMYTAVIRQISGSPDVHISSNRNTVGYPIHVEAFVTNQLAFEDSSSVITGTNNPTGINVGEEFTDIRLKLVFGVETDTQVVLEADPTLAGEGQQPLPLSAVTLTVNDQPVTGGSFVIPAGEESVTVKARLTDKSFIDPEIKEETVYVLPIVIKTVSGSEDVFIDPDNKILNFSVVIPDYKTYMLTSPTEGELQTDRTGYTSYVSTLDGSTDECPQLFDGSTGTYYYTGGLYAICVDLGSVQDVMGLRTIYFSGYYGAYDVDIYSSEDGETWTKVMELRDLPVQKTHDIGFFEPIRTRHLKYDVLESQYYGFAPTEFYIYAK